MPKNIDIVLIPPTHIVDLVVSLNEQDEHRNVALSKSDRIPHISLLMGVLEEEYEDELIAACRNIADNTPPLSLSLSDATDGCFGLEKSVALSSMQRILFAQVMPLLHTNASISDFVEGPDHAYHSNEPLAWVRHESKNGDFQKNFWPHLTVHANIPKDTTSPVPFLCSELAIYHMGDYCTARDPIATFPLS